MPQLGISETFIAPKGLQLVNRSPTVGLDDEGYQGKRVCIGDLPISFPFTPATSKNDVREYMPTDYCGLSTRSNCYCLSCASRTEVSSLHVLGQ